VDPPPGGIVNTTVTYAPTMKYATWPKSMRPVKPNFTLRPMPKRL